MGPRIVAVYGKNVSEGFFPYLRRMLCQLKERNIVLDCEDNFKKILGERFDCKDLFREVYNRDNLLATGAEMLLSIGGDGTFLDAVLYVKDSGIPVLGMNTGHLGFLANISVQEIDAAVAYIDEGKYTTEERNLLCLNVKGGEFPGFNYGLNEVSVHKTDTSSMLKIHAYIGDIYLTTYWADGLIVASPTGSTGYSLSGGGPIVHPECKNIILTPVCPHNLTMRTLLVPDDVLIRLKVEGRTGDFMLSLDSRIEKMKDDCEIEIKNGEFKIRVVNLPGHNYYGTLRNKLGWGEDFRNRNGGENKLK